MAEARSGESGVPLSELPAEEKAVRSGSFGEVAAHYDRFRPGPPMQAVDWLLPGPVDRVVDLGAGTGALTRLLVERGLDVVAIEPDDRMRAVLSREVPAATAVPGRGEAMVLPDGSVDAVLASSSWHWMDPIPALREVARVLKPDGILGALWTGPDPEGAFMAQAQALLAEQLDAPRDDRRADIVAEVMLGDVRRPVSRLEIPPGVGFEQPEHRALTWDIPLDADELIGLLGTLSWVITMPEDARSLLVSEARRLLGELLGIEGDVTVDVAFRSDVWRTRTTGG